MSKLRNLRPFQNFELVPCWDIGSNAPKFGTPGTHISESCGHRQAHFDTVLVSPKHPHMALVASAFCWSLPKILVKCSQCTLDALVVPCAQRAYRLPFDIESDSSCARSSSQTTVACQDIFHYILPVSADKPRSMPLIIPLFPRCCIGPRSVLGQLRTARVAVS